VPSYLSNSFEANEPRPFGLAHASWLLGSTRIRLLTAVNLEAKEPRSREHVRKGESAMTMFEGPDRNRNITIAVVVVIVIAVIIYWLYAAGYLSGII